MADSIVQSESRGPIRMDQLKEGDRVLAFDSNNQLHFSKVLLFLDVDEFDKRSYVEVFTDLSNGPRIRLTESHLLYVSDSIDSKPQVEFAGKLKPGQYIHSLNPEAISGEHEVDGQNVVYLDTNSSRQLRPELVTKINIQVLTGAFAPLTESGNLLVDSTLVSCYAQISNQQLAHFAFLPIRASMRLSAVFYSFWDWMYRNQTETSPGQSSKASSIENQVSASVANKPLAFVENEIDLKANESMQSDSSLSSKSSLSSSSSSSSIQSELLPTFAAFSMDRRNYNSKLLQLKQTSPVMLNRSARVHRRQGMHWYARLLYTFAQLIIPSDYMYH